MSGELSTGSGTTDKVKKNDEENYDGDFKDGKRHGYGKLTKKVPSYPSRSPHEAHK
jgi:hypothetical protein